MTVAVVAGALASMFFFAEAVTVAVALAPSVAFVVRADVAFAGQVNA